MSLLPKLVLSLPGELFNSIYNLVPQAARLANIEKLKSQQSSFHRKSHSDLWIWGLFFKPVNEINNHWFRVVQEQNERQKESDDFYYHGAIPILLGSDLEKIDEGYSGLKLVLLANDWTGDLCYSRDSFFNSLQPHKYNKHAQEVYFPQHGITLNIADMFGSEDILVKNPKYYFQEDNDQLYTYALYYNAQFKEKIRDIDGIKGRKKWNMVRTICSVKTKFEDGTTCYRILENRGNPLKEGYQSHKTKVDGREWYTGWSKPRQRRTLWR